jgi:hypothetical protein
MGTIMKLVGVAALVVVVFFSAVMMASETSGEVVSLRTYREDGLSTETSLWVVEDRRLLYLRAGDPESGWLVRLKANPEVELTRGGETRSYRARVMPGLGSRINELMAEKYGWGDILVGVMRDDASVIAVRLDLIRS